MMIDALFFTFLHRFFTYAMIIAGDDSNGSGQNGHQDAVGEI